MARSAGEPGVLGGAPLAGAWEPVETPPWPVRAARWSWWFTRRKPLGAFGALLVFLLFFLAVFGGEWTVGPVHFPGLAPSHYNEYDLLQASKAKFQGPSWEHLMGTDQLGRDVFSRLLYGARLSVFIGVGVFTISTLLSTTLTLVSGYYVRSVDLVLQRVVEVVGFLPDLIILVALFSMFSPSPTTFILTLGILGGITTSRVLRALVIGLRGTTYVEAAKALGASDRRIILRHILPNVMPYIIVGATTAIAGAVTIESGLAIIGIGLDPSYPSWGNMLNDSREHLRRAPHMAVAPGLMIAMTIFGFRLLGDALRDVLDPRLRGRR